MSGRASRPYRPAKLLCPCAKSMRTELARPHHRIHLDSFSIEIHDGLSPDPLRLGSSWAIHYGHVFRTWPAEAALMGSGTCNRGKTARPLSGKGVQRVEVTYTFPWHIYNRCVIHNPNPGELSLSWRGIS